MPAGGQRNRGFAAGQVRRPSQGRGPRAPGLAGWWRARSERAQVLLAGGSAVALVAVLALVVTAVVPSPTAVRARQYLAFTACLLTGSQGLASPQAALAWAGMQEASLATRAKVEYLPVMSGSTEAAAAPVLASLVQRHCNVVIAAGRAQVSALVSEKARPPGVRFVAMGGAPAGSGVLTVPASGSGVRPAVDQIITSAVATAG